MLALPICTYVCLQALQLMITLLHSVPAAVRVLHSSSLFDLFPLMLHGIRYENWRRAASSSRAVTCIITCQVECETLHLRGIVLAGC